MTGRSGAIYGAAATLALVLWMLNAPPVPDDWPLPPFDPGSMSIDGLLLAYGHMPRGVMALLAGASLGLAGALLQTVLRNPIADPSTLGISSGAQLALILATVMMPDLLLWGRWPVALAGAAIATGVVMSIGAARDFHPVTMVIAGMLVGLFASSLAAALTLAQGQYLFSLVVWTGGSLVQTEWSPTLWLGAIFATGALLTLLIARPLGILGIEATGARALGINVTQIRMLAVILAALLAASVSATVGLVAFVGLAAPAVARALGARRPGQILLQAPLAGALILSLCDGFVLSVAQAGGEMFPTGAVTGLIGGPLLLWLLPRLRGTPPPATEDIPRRLPRPAPLLVALAGITALMLLTLAMIGRVPGGWAVLDRETLALFLPNRLPRLAGAAAAGGLLALAGTMLQRLTANPLASPEVLGVSGGAAIGYAGILFSIAAPSILLLSAGAAAGGALALITITSFVMRRDMRPERLLLAGIAVSALAAALLSALMAAGTMQSFAILAWLSGSSATLGPIGAGTLCLILLLLLTAAIGMHRWLAILPLGGAVAQGLGVPIRTAWTLSVLIAGLATGAATVIVGPLSFVGLMAPHLARRIGFARAGDHVTGSVLIGATLMLAADFGARMASFPYDLPLGLFASLLGTPWLIWLMLRRPA